MYPALFIFFPPPKGRNFPWKVIHGPHGCLEVAPVSVAPASVAPASVDFSILNFSIPEFWMLPVQDIICTG